MPWRREPRKNAFSLVELLVVIGVISIVGALLFPALRNAKASAKRVACISQLRQLGIHSFIYAADNNDQFPIEPRADRFLSPFPSDLGMRKLFICPADVERSAGTNLALLNRTNTSYFASYSTSPREPRSIVAGDRNVTVFNQTARVQVRQTGAIQLYRTNAFGWWRDIHRSKGNLLLGDGSAQNTTARTFTMIAAEQPEPSFAWNIPNGDSIRSPHD